jgi:allophanate hydrolase subunit 1
MLDKYKVILDRMKEIESRPEVLFRQVGDRFLQVEYGHTQRAYLPDSFRIQAVDSRIKEKNLKGLIETVPGLRTNLFHFDFDILDINKLIYEIKKIEDEFISIDDIIITSRIIHLPIAFEDSETKKAVEKYVKEVRPDAPNVIDGYNIKFIALCNGVRVDEVKKMILATEWYNSGCGFWPGGGFFWPMDPRSALIVPKYNPPRIWTPEGAVGIGGPCIFTYTTPTGGGYQLFGRTIPTFQFSQKHSLFKNSPFLYKSADRIKFHETTEDEILKIFEHVHDKTDYKYEIKAGEIIVREYLDFYNSVNVQEGIQELKHRQKEAKKRISEI